MKNLKTILRFELDNYFKSKSYLISTILICIIAAVIMFVPRIADSIKGDGNKSDSSVSSDKNNDDLRQLAICGDEKYIDLDVLSTFFDDAKFVICDNKDEVSDMVSSGDAEAGFAINSLTDYDYYVLNKSMFDDDQGIFTEYMGMMVKMDYCTRNNLDIEEFMDVSYMPIQVNEQILGKDSASNYWYCYILVIIIFMLIIMYGTTIASSVTNEKSNRSIEILVTSTSSTAILFGKVFAGAIATVFQTGLVGLSLLGSYQFNKDYWGNGLAMFLDIPANVLVTFAVFGIGGFLLYAFMYGALGALVSKIEDLNKTAGTAQMVVMIVYFVVLAQLSNTDGIIIKVCSYLPISSYSAMFARVAMGSVATWEVVLSAVILYASVVLMGIIGGKIFRSSTLRYGNPIKLTNALKGLKKQD